MRYLPLVIALGVVVGCKGKSTRKPDDAGVQTPSSTGTGPATLPEEPVVLPPAPDIPAAVRGLPPTPSPEHNPTTPAKVALGQLLFFDKRLSRGDKMSCATCHDPNGGWTDEEPLSRTITGALNMRHTPSLYNVGYAESLYWDGRMPTLEALILSNWKGQMGANPGAIAKRLAAMPVYRAHFERAFGADPTGTRIAEALAAFVRTLRSGNAPWDAYEDGEQDAVSQDAIAGAGVFANRAGCGLCHSPPLYTDHGYHNIKVPGSDPETDPGRYRVTKADRDLGAFRTPGLRGLSHTAPYFHNGSAATVRDVIDLKLRTADIRLTEDEMRQLLAFLSALTPDEEPITPPRLPKEPPPQTADGGIVPP